MLKYSVSVWYSHFCCRLQVAW